ncbi:acyl transferase/acyl hydrolase/lysophospholipase [Bisporella sp. PMI_857]|nr:acyl transferase/acyl hydrolase/lysophospholipase [Bisporella sp. PMI_857]
MAEQYVDPEVIQDTTDVHDFKNQLLSVLPVTGESKSSSISGEHGQVANPEVSAKLVKILVDSQSQDEIQAESTDNFQHYKQYWEQKCILTCDGGGIRGYATLLILAALMKYIGEIERQYKNAPHESSFCPATNPLAQHSSPAENGIMQKKTISYKMSRKESSNAAVVERIPDDPSGALKAYLPCHYFDYIIGTSTGGLIAIMLSRWRMPVDEALDKYKVFGGRIFGKPRKFSILGWPHNKHDKRELEEALKDIVREKTPGTAAEATKFRMLRSPDDLCRTAVVAVRKSENGSSEDTHIFRSYNVREATFDAGDPIRNYTNSGDHEIWKACRATTAAPTYFKSIEIDGDSYSDGGTEANNPTFEAIRELRLLHGRYPSIVASFGTGKVQAASVFLNQANNHPHWLRVIDRTNRLLKRATAALTEAEKTHAFMQETYRQHPDNMNYSRFNVEENLGTMKLNEWKANRTTDDGRKCSTLEHIEICTKAELAKRSTQEHLKILAERLVELRRQRTRDTDRWDRFARCISYQCKSPGCTFSSTIRRGMEQHIRTVHAGNVAIDECLSLPDVDGGPY